MSKFFKMQYGDWTKYHATQDLGPINTWTIPSTTTDVVSYSSEDTISLNGKGGHYETCYKAFTVERSGQYTISYDYDLPTVNFYGTTADHMYFGVFITTNVPPGGDMATYSAYSTGNCNGYVICGPSSQNNSPGVGSASFTYNLTAGVTYYLWIPMMNLADGVQTYLTFTNLKWTETAESDLFEPIGIAKYNDWNGSLYFVQENNFITYTTDGHGTLTGDFTAAPLGTIVTLTATPNTNYALSGYAITGATLTGNAFTMNSVDVTAYAAFSAVPQSALYWSTTASNTAGARSSNTKTISKAVTAFNYFTIKFQHQASHSTSVWADYTNVNFNTGSWSTRAHYQAGNYKPVRNGATFTAANSNVKTRTTDGAALRYYTSIADTTNATYKFVIDRSAARCSAFLNNTYLGYGNVNAGITALNNIVIGNEQNGGSTAKQYYLAGFKNLSAAVAY